MRRVFAFFSPFLDRHSFALALSLSLILFVLRLFLKDSIPPEILFSSDYFGHIRLGQNIFNDFNFLVLWDLDQPVVYPPFFSMIIYWVTRLTHAPLESIRLINIFSVSFAPFFIYLGSRRLFDPRIALAAAVFCHYYFELIRPIRLLHIDYFFVFFVAALYWMILKAAASKARDQWLALGAGVLIAVAYLTKFQGGAYLFIALAAVFLFSSPIGSLTKRKYILILAGFLPFYLIYQAIIWRAADHADVCPIAVATVIDVNADYEYNRIFQPYVLDESGNEFRFQRECEQNGLFTVLWQKRKTVIKNYHLGFHAMGQRLAAMVFPFFPTIAHLPLQAVLFFLLILGFQTRYAKALVYVFLFLAGIFWVPLFDGGGSTIRYYMPYVPFYFLLWLGGAQVLSEYLRRKEMMRWATRWGRSGGMMILCLFLVIYGYEFYQKARWWPRYDYGSYERAARRLAQARNIHRPFKIMAPTNIMSFLTDSRFIMFPYDFDWERIVRFARIKKVDYIIYDARALEVLRPEQKRHLKNEDLTDLPVTIIYNDPREGDRLVIYDLDERPEDQGGLRILKGRRRHF